MHHSRRSKARSGYVVTTLLAASLVVVESARALDCIGASPDDSRSVPVQTALPDAGLVWEWPDHRAWFHRFWSGTCAEQLDDCWEGAAFAGMPHWRAVMAETLDRAAPADRPHLRCRLIALGRRIGHEWSRESQVRAIDTARLQTWADDLETAHGRPEIDRAIDRLEAALTRARGGD